MSRWLRFRLPVDRVVAAVVLGLASPLVGLLAQRVRAHDGGRAVIAVPRAGRGGEAMRMWKLRSMREETPTGLAGGSSLTRSGDDRVTPIGRRLRELHLDELPQLYNVVRGEMALLGPRPEAPEFVRADDPAWQAVLEPPPGIAGPTQLLVGDWERTVITEGGGAGAYVRDVLPVKLAIDRWYVQNASAQLDLLIVTAFAGRLLRHRRPLDALRRRVEGSVPEAGEIGR